MVTSGFEEAEQDERLRSVEAWQGIDVQLRVLAMLSVTSGLTVDIKARAGPVLYCRRARADFLEDEVISL